MMQQFCAESVSTFGKTLLSETASLDHSLLHSRRFKLYNLIVEAWFSDLDYANLCAQNLSQSELTDTGNTADISIYLLDSESLGWKTPPRWAEDVFDRLSANEELNRAGLRGAYLHAPRVWQFFSPDRKLGVQLIRCPGATPPWETGAPLRAFLHWAYTSSNCRLCHAATLGTPNIGVLIVGGGGSGKSGTTLSGIAAGLKTVGDDYCLIEEAETVAAYPLYNILKQDVSGAERAFGKTSKERFGPLNWQGKYEIHESALDSSPFAGKLDIRGILVPRVAHAPKSVIKPISPGHAMRAFAPSSAFQLPDGEREGVAFVAQLCRKLPCLEIQLSQDCTDIAESIRSLIENELL
jgi:hypothetical protein